MPRKAFRAMLENIQSISQEAGETENIRLHDVFLSIPCAPSHTRRNGVSASLSCPQVGVPHCRSLRHHTKATTSMRAEMSRRAPVHSAPHAATCASSHSRSHGSTQAINFTQRMRPFAVQPLCPRHAATPPKTSRRLRRSKLRVAQDHPRVSRNRSKFGRNESNFVLVCFSPLRLPHCSLV